VYPSFDPLASHWQWALDAAARALEANPDLGHHGSLAHERQEVAVLLETVAAAHHVPAPWLAPGPVTAHQLGLPEGTRACLFDLDGVLTDSASLHATAWSEALDPLLFELAHETGRHLVPFDRSEEYRTFFDGRPRLEAIALFFASRGIELSRARATELARRKGELVVHGLEHRGVAPLPGARRYLQAAGHARLGRAVISASDTTAPMLRLARIEEDLDVRIDAESIRTEELRSRPAPDVAVAACHRLGIEPGESVTLTHSGDGVVSALNAGLAVIGVATGDQAEALHQYGAERVVPSLVALLDPRLAAA
jgi:beta-phosphoglucomutase-like phosphatase (HAD superfamily)